MCEYGDTPKTLAALPHLFEKLHLACWGKGHPWEGSKSDKEAW